MGLLRLVEDLKGQARGLSDPWSLREVVRVRKYLAQRLHDWKPSVLPESSVYDQLVRDLVEHVLLLVPNPDSATVWGPCSISDDDLCASCKYRGWLEEDGDLARSTCTLSIRPWPGAADEDGYFFDCDCFVPASDST